MDLKVFPKKKKCILYGFLKEYEIEIDEDFYNALNKGKISNLIRVYVLILALRHAPWIPIGTLHLLIQYKATFTNFILII